VQEMLKIQDLWVSIDDRQVLKGVNFSMVMAKSMCYSALTVRAKQPL